MFHNWNCQIDPPPLSPFYFYVINCFQESRTTLTILNWKCVGPMLEQEIYLHNMYNYLEHNSGNI